jgi:hypothetical protein
VRKAARTTDFSMSHLRGRGRRKFNAPSREGVAAK